MVEKFKQLDNIQKLKHKKIGKKALPKYIIQIYNEKYH